MDSSQVEVEVEVGDAADSSQAEGDSAVAVVSSQVKVDAVVAGAELAVADAVAANAADGRDLYVERSSFRLCSTLRSPLSLVERSSFRLCSSRRLPTSPT